MADRFWVGGTANWDATAGTKWATTSGGAGGASVPTSADDVFFDATSGVVTCTISAGNTGAKSINCTGFTGTLAGSTAITVSGSVTLVAGMTFTYSGTLTLAGTGTITSAGKTFLGPITINGSGITVTLGDALTNNSGGNFLVSTGTFNTANFNLTLSGSTIFNSSAVGNIRAINLGSSTVSIAAGGTALSFAFNSGLTFNAGTSTIVCSGTSARITGGAADGGVGVTFNNVQFTSTAASTHNIVSSNTFNNLTVTSPAAAGVTQFTFDSRTTINGTLSTTGTAGNRRVWFRGVTYGIAQTLTINSAPSLTDADFRDIYVIGTAAPISGTRVGDLRGCRGITFDAPKTVYWNLSTSGAWSRNGWATSSGGAVSTDNFPLAQDTAIIDNTGLGTSNTLSLDLAIPYYGTIDMSGRTNAMTLNPSNPFTVYGNWIMGAGVAMLGNSIGSFSGRNTQTITSNGKTLSFPVTVDSYGGTLELADALNIGSNTLTVTNGTFDTKNYNVTAGSLSSSNSNVRAITLGSSTVTLSGATTPINFSTATNLTFSCGTSTINSNNSGTQAINCGSFLTFYNLTSTSAAAGSLQFSGTATSLTFNSVTLTATSSAGLKALILSHNLEITGTLTVDGATPIRRIFAYSNTIGTTRTLTVNSLSATDCDFRDITIAGTAAGSSPTRAGDCGGNTGITFPAAKTVYWNLSSTSTWFGNGWCPTSGGTPDVNSFPLAQDTAVFDDAGAATQVNPNVTCNIGAIDMSARTTAITSQFGACTIYGNVTLTSALTINSSGTGPTFSGRITQTITSNGIILNNPITIDCFTGTVQLADALTLNAARTLTLTSGTFDAVTYNVTTGFVSVAAAGNKTLKMGSGTWSLTAIGTVWDVASGTGVNFYKGSANIELLSTSTNARSFNGGSLSYNKLTIGGATGTSTLTITGNNQFTELASTKTVAHTIALGATTQTFGAWTVSGTAGNVVTVSGTATITIAGARVSGVDYLAMGTTTVSATSPGEFYAGANSTGTGANIIKTAAPTPVTRYWVGGTGTWDATTTTKWSDTSGGSGGFSVPTSADAVVFDALSNATAYTVTCTATQLRCGSLTMAGPASGNITWAGTAPIAMHDNVSLAATGITRTYSGGITLSGSTTGKTFTTNGVSVVSPIAVNGVGCGWSLGSAWVGASTFTITNGLFDTANYALTGSLVSSNNNTRTISLGSSTLTSAGNTPVDFAINTNLTFNAGTSSIVCSGTGTLQFRPATSGTAGVTFNNVSFTAVSAHTLNIRGVNTFNNLSITGITSAGLKIAIFTDNQTITDTLSLLAGTNATMRTFVQSDTIGTTRTLTATFADLGDTADFRDITLAGGAAGAGGSGLGDCKGNSGITFPAAKTVYYRNTAGNWGATTWSFTNNGTADVTAFPLAQDTAVFPSSPVPYPSSGATCTSTVSYNIGTIDMSARTSNTMTLATSTSTPSIYGNWINGTGTTLTGTGYLNFSGRGSQTITSAGRTFTQPFSIDTPGGSVTLQDAFETSRNIGGAVDVVRGTFNANTYNVTISGANSSFASSYSNVRTVALGSGTLLIAGTSGFVATNSTNLTVTGTGTISLTSASAKTFAGGGISYSGITLNQGGAGTLTITGNNTFANITNSYSATGATTIAMGTTTQRVGSFTASGEAGRVLTVQGTSASSPATLVFTGSGQATAPTTDYLTITGVRAYSLDTTWYAGANSTNNGSLGWYFEAGGGGPISVFIIESATSADAQGSLATLNISMSETTTAADAAAAGFICLGTLSESATVADAVEAFRAFLASVAESATSSELVSAALTLAATISELTTGADATAVTSRVTNPTIAEAAQMADSLSGGLLFLSSISEATTAQEIAASVLIFNRAVSEATTASEVLAAVAAFNAAVPESVSGADVANALLTVGGSINEALTALDEAVAANNMTANVGSLPQDMAQLPVGTSAAGSVIFDDTSFTGTAAIFANGTGTGSTGGFNLGGNYFGYSGGFGGAFTPYVDWGDVTHVRIELIAGTGTNGGPEPADNFTVGMQAVFGMSITSTVLATITKDAATTLISVVARIPDDFRYRVASFSFRAASATTSSTPSWGVKNITFYFGGGSAAESTTNVYTANPVIAETANPLDAAQVVASTFSAASAETATPLDAPQGANTGSSSLSESATVSEAQAAQFTAATAISEASTVQESVSSLAVLSGPIVEAAALADTSVAPSVFSAVALAAAQAAESFNPAGSVYNASAAVSVVAVDALRRSKLRVVDIEAFVSTGANVTAMTAEATVTGNTASGTVESGQITATVLP